MSKFVCGSCGAFSPTWVGKCPQCDEWNTYEEEVQSPKLKVQNKSRIQRLKPKTISIDKISAEKNGRMSTGIGELDRVLGGGIVKGSAILISGEPGIGKSTIMLQIADSLSKEGKVAYISGEESVSQIKLRAERLKITSSNLFIVPQTDLFEIEKEVNELKPDYMMIDSIQTIEREDISSGAGSVSQVKECSSYIVQLAKDSNIPVFIVGQVTKEGSVAGPRIMEHMVDTVLYFEGDEHRQFRILRATKNRFGSTNEVGIFEMTDKGLIEVLNPSKVLIDEQSLGAAGSAVTSAVEGTRPLLIEIQALVAPSKLASPRRVVTGLDYNRCSIIIGVLEKKASIRLGDSDIFLNVASGLYVDEPAADIAIACAIASSVKNKGIDPKTILTGELGLTGEVRGVSHVEQRIKEAVKLGFKTALVPRSNEAQLKALKGIKIVAVSNIKELMERMTA